VNAPERVWWIVTLREEFDEEDSLYILNEECADKEAAVAAAEAALLDDKGYNLDELPVAPVVYINHVVRCVSSTEPTHEQSVPV
jgi:hypothetical protein